jgi:peroxiredoxin Q/BCP
LQKRWHIAGMKRLLVAFLALLGCNLHAKPLAVGADAPKIVAPDENGQPFDLGKACAKGLTLVYFYPKAMTGGCTAQACSLRDSIVDLKNLGVTVIGVSHDSPAAQKAFKDKYQLPFTLIADEKGEVIAAFGVPTLPGGMAMRQSFLVRDGKVVWYCPTAQTTKHAKEVEAAVAKLK